MRWPDQSDAALPASASESDQAWLCHRAGNQFMESGVFRDERGTASHLLSRSENYGVAKDNRMSGSSVQVSGGSTAVSRTSSDSAVQMLLH